MGSYPRPFFEIDQAVVCVGQATTQIAAQEERVSLERQRGDDTAQSERLLGILKEWRQRQQGRYETILQKTAGEMALSFSAHRPWATTVRERHCP